MSSNKRDIILEAVKLGLGYKKKGGEHVICDSVDFELYEGELVGLIGPNGAGKSTLIRTLANMQTALTGSVIIDGSDINSYSPVQLAKQLSVVLTEPIATKNLTVYEIVALGRQPYTNWIGTLTATDKDKVDEAIELAMISEFKDRKGYELSDGQMQNVMIARALAQDTRMIILDEPTTHLDLYHKAHILSLLKSLTVQTNRTIFYASHEIDLALQICDRLVVIHKGNATAGTVESHIESGILNSMFPDDLIAFDKESSSFRITNQN